MHDQIAHRARRFVSAETSEPRCRRLRNERRHDTHTVAAT